MSDIKITHVNFRLDQALEGKEVYIVSHDKKLIGLITEDVLAIHKYTEEAIKDVLEKMLKQTNSSCIILAKDEDELKRKVKRSKTQTKTKIFW